jgi:hypothetical protein
MNASNTVLYLQLSTDEAVNPHSVLDWRNFEQRLRSLVYSPWLWPRKSARFRLDKNPRKYPQHLPYLCVSTTIQILGF